MPLGSLVDFIETLSQSRLLTAAQLEEVRRDLQARFSEPRALAKELVQRGWLTPYQINHLFQGHAQDLILGSYVILERLGEGGMGQVFKARNQKLGKIVALKVIRKERLDSPDAVKRFYREIQAAAQLSHPNIVHAYDADEVGGTHFFAMEYVEGIDLAKVLKQRGPMPVDEACEYIRQAALGLQHAYECGLVHRDIKPANLLLTNARGSPSLGVVKLLDMGLARVRLSDDTGDSYSTLTREGTVMGTLDYIAPEQAKDSRNVDIRADLYSLGCTLYQLLTGKVPFPKGTAMEKLIKHQVEEPPALEERRPDVPPGVAEIVRRLMAKRREDRFATPAELAVALEPFCPGWPGQSVAMSRTPQRRGVEDSAPATRPPVEATPPPDTQPSQPPDTAPPAIVAHGDLLPRKVTGGLGTPRLVLVLGISSVLFIGMIVAVIISLSSRPSTPGQAATPSPQSGQAPPTAVVTVQVEANKPWQDTGVEVEVNMPITIRIYGWWKMEPQATNCSAEGQAGAPKDRNVLADAPAMCLLARIGNEDTPSPLGVQRNWFPKSSGRLFVQANDLDLEDNAGTLTLEILNTARKEGVAPSPAPTSVQAADLARKKLAAEAEQAFTPFTARFTDPKTDLEPLRLDMLAFRVKYPGTPAALRGAEILAKLPSPLDRLDPAKIPDDAKAAWRAGGREPPVELVGVLGEHRQRNSASVSGVWLSDDCRTIIASSHSQDGGKIHFWDTHTGDEIAGLRASGNDIRASAISADRTLMATCHRDATVRLWDVKARQRLRQLDNAPQHAQSVAFTPDGKSLVGITYGSVPKNPDEAGEALRFHWDVVTGKLTKTVAFPIGWPSGHNMAITPDNRTLALACQLPGGGHGSLSGVIIIDLQTDRLETLLGKAEGAAPHSQARIALTTNGQKLAVSRPNQVALFDVASRKALWTVEGTPPAAFFPNDQKLVTGDGQVIDVASGNKIASIGFPRPNSIAFVDDGKTIVTGHSDGTVRLWDVETGKEVRPLSGYAGAVWNVGFDAEGKLLAARGGDGVVRLWEMPEGKERHVINTNAPTGFYSMANLAFSPDGRSIALAAKDGHVKVWNADDGREQGDHPLPQDSIVSLAISPDGKTLAAGTFGGRVSLRDLASGKEQRQLDANAPDGRREVFCLAFSPNGRTLATGTWSWEKALRIWDIDTGREIRVFPGHEGHIFSMAFTPDGRHLISASADATVRVWEAATAAERHTMKGHQAAVHCIALAPGGKTVASAGADGRVVLWEILSGAKLREWQLPGPVLGVAFASDGRHLATANANGTVYILRLAQPPPTLQAAEKTLKELLAKFDDAKVDREKLREEVVEFRKRFAGMPQAQRAAELLPKLPSPLDKLDPAKIPEDAKAAWRAGGREPPVELVGVLGEHRRRHWGLVSCVACSPDGKILASASEDGLLWLRDAETLRELLPLKGTSGRDRGVAFSPNSQRVAASDGSKIVVWDTHSGHEVHRLPSARANCLAFSSDGNRLFEGGGDNVIRLWDLKSGTLIRRFEGHTGSGAFCLALAPAGDVLLSGGHDETVRWWGVDTGKEIRRFTHPDAPGSHGHVWSLALSRDGRRAVTGTNDGTVRIWEIATGKELKRFDLKGAPWSVAFSADASSVLASVDRTVVLLNAETGKQLRHFEGHTGPVFSVAFHPGKRRIVSGSGDGTVRLWDVETGKEVQPLTGPTGRIKSVALSPDDRSLLTGGDDQVLRLWDLLTQKESRRFEAQQRGINSVAFSPTARHVASGNYGSTVLVWDVESGKELRRWYNEPIWSVVFSTDGQQVLSGGYNHTNKNDATVILWNVESGDKIRLFTDSALAQTTSVALSPDGQRVLSAAVEPIINVWNARTGQVLHRLTGHAAAINSLAISPDGRQVLSGSSDKSMRLWDLEAGRELRRFEGHEEGVSSVAFGPDGKMAASASGLGRIILWDIASGAKLREWQLPGPVHDVKFASDGRHLATANGNGTVYILRLSSSPGK